MVMRLLLGVHGPLSPVVLGCRRLRCNAEALAAGLGGHERGSGSRVGYSMGDELVTQRCRLFRDTFGHFGPISVFVVVHTLAHIMRAVLQETVDPLSDLARCRHQGLGPTRPRLDATVECSHRVLGVMATLSRHPKGECCPVSATAQTAVLDLASTAAM